MTQETKRKMDAIRAGYAERSDRRLAETAETVAAHVVEGGRRGNGVSMTAEDAVKALEED